MMKVMHISIAFLPCAAPPLRAGTKHSSHHVYCCSSLNLSLSVLLMENSFKCLASDFGILSFMNFCCWGSLMISHC